MSYNESMHSCICRAKELTEKFGRPPTQEEFGVDVLKINILFGSYDKFLVAAGVLDKEDLIAVQEGKPRRKKFKYKKSLVQSFHRVETELEELFEAAGNPEVYRLVAQGDTHTKHRSVPALTAFMKFNRYYKPHGHLIMGDFMDVEALSHWDNDGLEPRVFMDEVIEARGLLGELVESTKEATFRAYLKGNHEDWIDQAKAAKLPALFNGLDKIGLDPDLEALLDLERFGYDLIDLNHILRIGKANFTHGLYVGANHPKKHLDVLKENIYYGHLHDEENTRQTSINGLIEAASVACLCRLDARFLKGKPNNWSNGFGVFEFRRDGSYTRYQVRIINGKFTFNGIDFEG